MSNPILALSITAPDLCSWMLGNLQPSTTDNVMDRYLRALESVYADQDNVERLYLAGYYTPVNQEHLTIVEWVVVKHYTDEKAPTVHPDHMPGTPMGDRLTTHRNEDGSCKPFHQVRAEACARHPNDDDEAFRRYPLSFCFYNLGTTKLPNAQHLVMNPPEGYVHNIALEVPNE